ncbi:THO complex subunit 1 transcription elongation factor-domain-containing protein [Amylocarpus encephaloides]|uniref:guanylate kinase n=1 Tax=Amylocarpus encephaloides TaxID=45428 RepID=A0A9P8C647_9HELO|nr:THO complex subunit 1 transcription elongation factor-domain-containing protein [Amylocarpus encephaloides]
MEGHGVQAVCDFDELLQEMLQKAREVKPTNTVEPPLNKPDLGDLFNRINTLFASLPTPEVKKRSQYAIIETAARDAYYHFLANTTIDAPEFVGVWHLLDIISILSDDEQSDPALLFWLVEELLDSQTITGCGKVFDYLESRRDRITKKHFLQKQLVILRSCNELLRRLSRAEDTAFCGRVFIFLFQSFPLGDKSSVNLRGEFHTENVTTYDECPEGMEVDSDNKVADSTLKVPVNDATSSQKPTEGSNGLTPTGGNQLSMDQLYPLFWSMQKNFSQPKNLFDKETFFHFKSAVEATTAMFESVVQRQSGGRAAKHTEESRRSPKRKRDQGGDDLANAFNPKYLTSRDLFELEVRDISFRRHILIQILIVLDFLLSLSPDAKEKLSKATLPPNPNKSVMYADFALSPEDTKWAEATKTLVLDFLKSNRELDGAHFHRMIESVLSRDKNWVRWKIENCPSIARDGITPEEYTAIKAAARKAAANKRIRPTPLGSLNLNFLSDSNAQAGLERLKDPKRYQIPAVNSFKSKIELDDMDIEMAMTDADKNSAIESKASKSWRALRIASTTSLAAFDKIERSDKIDEVFTFIKSQDPIISTEEDKVDLEDTMFPKDKRPIIIAGPSGVGKSVLIKMLMEKHPKALERKVSHTTRTPREGEVDGQHYHFITKETHSMMRDGDELLEYNNYNGNDYGTSRKVVKDITAKGKVPVMEMEHHGIQQTRDNGFTARFIFIAPPSMSGLETRLRKRSSDSDEEIQGRLKIAQDEIDQSKLEGSYDTTFVNDQLEETYKQLETYIFEHDDSAKDAPAASSTEVNMADSSTS